MRIIQWNIYREEKIENIVEFLRQVNGDIICLQELTLDSKWNKNLDTPDIVAEELEMNHLFAPAQSFPDGGTQENVIFSKYPIKKKSSFFVQKSKGLEVKAWDEGRVVVEAELDIQGTKIKIATVHLSYTHKLEETEQKMKEVDKLLGYIRKKSKNFVITGDFNVTPASKTIKEIKKHLIHCGPSYNIPTWTTKPFDYEGFEETRLRWRLDYAFCTSDIIVKSAKIGKTNYSDHLPIIIDVELSG